MMMMSRTVAPRAVTSRAEKATRSARRGTSATRSVVTSASSAVERVVKGVERACDKVNLAAITAMTTLTSAGAAHAVDAVHASETFVGEARAQRLQAKEQAARTVQGLGPESSGFGRRFHWRRRAPRIDEKGKFLAQFNEISANLKEHLGNFW